MNGWREFAVPRVVREVLKGGGAISIHGWQRECDDDGHLSVLVALEPDHERVLRWHLSISHRTNDTPPQPGRYPTWDEIADARYDLLPDDITVAMLLPPRDQYVNVHPTTFHLHEIDGDPSEVPPITMPRTRRGGDLLMPAEIRNE